MPIDIVHLYMCVCVCAGHADWDTTDPVPGLSELHQEAALCTEHTSIHTRDVTWDATDPVQHTLVCYMCEVRFEMQPILLLSQHPQYGTLYIVYTHVYVVCGLGHNRSCSLLSQHLQIETRPISFLSSPSILRIVH